MKGKKRSARVVAFLLILGLVMGGGLMAAVHIAGGQERVLSQSDCVIVLGARVMPDGALSTTLEHRIETALDVYEKGYAGAFILCGAKGADEPTSEAAAMAAYLKRQGVPEGKIFLEDKSVNTFENLKNARAIMEASGMETAILVTSDYHLTRAMWIAEDAGLSVVGAPAPGPDLWYNQVKARLRETLSWINYFVTARLFR